MVRMIVAGSRSFSNYAALEKKLTEIIYKIGLEYSNQNFIKTFENENVFQINKEAIEIISGMADGADSMGITFANRFGLRLKEFPAKWDDFSVENCHIKTNIYGKKYNALAGHNRNLEMANYATADNSLAVLALFWDGKSHGSKDMKKIAQEKGMIIFETKDR